jgi:uncharacterized protein DUF6259
MTLNIFSFSFRNNQNHSRYVYMLLIVFIISTLLVAPAGYSLNVDQAHIQIQEASANWKAQPNNVRSREIPNRLTQAVEYEAINKNLPAYNVTDSPSGTFFQIIGKPSETRTMQWTLPLDSADNLTYQYYTIRYRAKGIRRDLSKYPVISLKNKTSENNKLPLIDSAQVINDESWHTLVGKLPKASFLESLAIELSTADSDAFLELGSIGFYKTTPHIADKNIKPIQFMDKKFTPINISDQCTISLNELTDDLINSYTQVVDLTNPFLSNIFLYAGVPFSVTTGKNIIRPENNKGVLKETKTFLNESVTRFHYFKPTRRTKTEIPINKRVSEVFFILVSEMPTTVSRYGVPQTPLRIEDVEVVNIELHYADGESENAFPYSILDKGFIIQRTTGVYAVAADRNRTLTSVTIHNKSFNVNINVAGVTVNTSTKRQIYEMITEPRPYRVEKLAPLKKKSLFLKNQNSIITCGNSFYTLTLDCTDGLAITQFAHGMSQLPISLDTTSGIMIDLGNQYLTGNDFSTESITATNSTATITLKSKNSAFPVTITIEVSVNDSPWITFNASVENFSSNTVKATINFPYIKDLKIGALKDTWLYFPKYRSVFDQESGFHIATNNQAYPLQFFDIFNPSAGIGITVLTHNLNHAPLSYCANKTATGYTSYLMYPKEFYALQPHAKINLTETNIAPHAGDWHTAMNMYNQWRASWYKLHCAKNRDWFMNISLVRAEYVSNYYAKKVCVTGPMLNRNTGEINIDEVLAADEAYDGIMPQMLHFPDWFYDNDGGNNKYSGNYNLDYIDPKQWAAFRKELKEEYNMPISFYFLTDRIAKNTKAAKAFAKQAARIRHNGDILENENVVYTCLGDKVWRNEFIRQVVAAQNIADLKAVYLDVFGPWASNPCCNPNHNHNHVPYWYNQITNDVITEIRDALPEDTILWSEYQLSDVNSQYTDGNLTYYYLPTHDVFAKSYDLSEKALTHIQPFQNVFRFAFPEIKQLAFPVGIEMELNSALQLKNIFFNGEGLYDCTWRLHPDSTRDIIKRYLNIHKTYIDCFNSQQPEPFVQTERGHVYANKFSGKNRTIWTLFNGRFTTIRGPVIAIDHQLGATYYDAWNQKTLTPKIVNGKAIIELKMNPQELGYIVQSTN